MHVTAGKANTNISKYPLGKGKDAVSSDMIQEIMIMHPETKASKGSGELFVHVCITLRSLAPRSN